MPWCPKCKAEYRDGFSQCTDCNISLIDNNLKEHEKEKEEENKENRNDIYSMKPCKLISVSDHTEAAMIGARLDDAGIPFFTEDHGCGGYLKLYMGFTVYGEDIYVDIDNYDMAKELIDVSFNVEDDDSTPAQELLPNSIKYVFQKRRKTVRIILFIYLFSIVGGLFLKYYYH